LSRESKVCKVKDHNPNYENDESDEQEILAMVGTFSL
jgi:hypothetical protein